MTKLLAPEEAGLITTALAANLTRHFAGEDKGKFVARPIPMNGGSDDRILFSYKGDIGMRSFGRAIVKFFEEKTGCDGISFSGGIGYLDTYHCQEGAIRIFFGISPRTNQGFISLKFLDK